MPTLRGLPDQPEFSWWITLTRGFSAASASSRGGRVVGGAVVDEDHFVLVGWQ
ncbi:hypothetical protein SALBM311S_12548 [Streptomyces alboniger]